MSENILNNETPAAAEAPVAESASTESPAVTNEINLLDHVSADHKSLVDSKGFKSVDDVVKSYANLEKMVGNSVRIPPADASAEAKQEFYDKIKDLDGVVVKGDKDEMYNKLGRPESADGYKLQDVVNAEMFDKVPGLGEEINDFKTIAHEIGLSEEQASKLVEMRMGTLSGMEAQQDANREMSEKVLHELWGQDYDNRLNAAKQTAKIYSEKHPDAMADLINGPAGNNPALLSMLAELGGTFKEKGHEGMVTTNFGTTPDEAMRKIQDKRADPGFMKAYTDDRNVGHKKAVAELARLYQLANGA